MADVVVLENVAAGMHLARLRASDTAPADFQRHARLLGSLLALEAVRDIPTRSTEVESPLGPAPGVEPARPIVAVPILRAGLGLLPGLQDMLPSVTVGMIGLERDADTLEPMEYYRKVPPLEGAWALLLEPMLATGGSAAAAVEVLVEAGAAAVRVLSVVATEVACERIAKAGDNTRIVTAAIDPELNDVGYIVPGLGDFGDRLYGTPH